MPILHLKTAQNPNTRNWYRMLLNRQMSAFCVQVYGTDPDMFAVGMSHWFILCYFEKREEAEEMFSACLRIKPYERTIESLRPKNV